MVKWTKWKEALAVPRGHRYFWHVPDGKIAVADDSGSTPDKTNDGVLWLDTERPIRVTTSSADIPLIVASDGRKSYTGETVNGALEVALKFNMHVVLADAKTWKMFRNLRALEDSGKLSS